MPLLEHRNISRQHCFSTDQKSSEIVMDETLLNDDEGEEDMSFPRTMVC
jgi:hypothetical protein